MTEKEAQAPIIGKDKRGVHFAERVRNGTYKSPAIHVRLWQEAADKLHAQLKAMGCSQPDCLSLLDNWPALGATRKAIYAHLLICLERGIVHIEFQAGAGFHGIVKFVINDLEAFDAGPDAFQTVHSIAWARVPGRSVNLKTIQKHWHDIGLEESCKSSLPNVYTFSARRMAVHESMAKARRVNKAPPQETVTLVHAQAITVAFNPFAAFGPAAGSRNSGMQRVGSVVVEEEVVTAIARPVTMSSLIAIPATSFVHVQYPLPPPPAMSSSADDGGMAVARPVALRLVSIPPGSRLMTLAPPPPAMTSAFTSIRSSGRSTAETRSVLHFVNTPAAATASIDGLTDADDGLDFVRGGATLALDMLASVAVHELALRPPDKKQRRCDA